MTDTYQHICDTIDRRGAAFFLLVDPDHLTADKIPVIADCCNDGSVDAVLVGGSLLVSNNLHDTVSQLRAATKAPLILFPGNARQLSSEADAVLFLSLVSGRNSQYLIGEHVQASPILRELNIEPIPTGYMLIGSGPPTTAEYISNTTPIPRQKSDVAMATALAAEYLGMKMIYLEGGSGAELSVPSEMVRAVSEYVSLPVIVGGGIRTPESAAEKVANGAGVVVIGNALEPDTSATRIREFAQAIHTSA